MKNTKRNLRAALLAALLGATLLTFPGISAAADDSSTAASVQSKLGDSKYKNVKVTVENSIAILSGTVDLYEYKADADKRVHKVKGVTAVRNDIQVAGPNVSDQELNSKLLEKLTYDRVGYGNVFDAISLKVESGQGLPRSRLCAGAGFHIPRRKRRRGRNTGRSPLAHGLAGAHCR
jgi:hypothetical protein